VNKLRYIGSKANLLNNIQSCINENIKTEQKVFCDIFSGTTVVSQYFKSTYEIISNDSLYFSYVLQKAFIENNTTPKFTNLKRTISEPLSYLENSKIEKHTPLFIEENYSPTGKDKRMYFTKENAKRIDFIRTKIELWRQEKTINSKEYFYLLACLLEAVPSISNTTGTYGAYLKQWDKRAFNKLQLIPFQIQNNCKNNKAYNEDVFNLIKHISGDILYLDPPYNPRQYASNYHVLETIAKYDNPKLTGITGMRPYENQKSVFCLKNEVNDAFEQLIKQADFSHIVLSYNSTGLMSSDFIEKILKENCIASTYQLVKIPYRKYKSKIYNESNLCEYLFYIQKKKQSYIYTFEKDKPLLVASPLYKCKSTTQKYIKSPLNYIGGKFKLLPQLIPLLPKKINTFVDLFCGGCNVGINTNCKKLVFNDMNTILVEMFSSFASMRIEDLIFQIESTIKKWNLSMTNEESFLEFRKHYNNTKNPIDLYILSCFSFNYQFRFNNDHEYNNPFGRNRSYFSETMKSNLIRFMTKLKSTSAEFTSYDFLKFPLDNISTDDFVYCDPPYLITTGSYNDGNRGFKNWSEDSDKALYSMLDDLNNRKIHFALSNVFTHKGASNDFLINWAKKYNVYHLHKNYSNSSYNTSREGSDEVLITNYNGKNL